MEDESHLKEGMITGSDSGAGGLSSFFSSFTSAVGSAFGACTTRRVRINDRTLRVVKLLAEGGFSSVYLCECEDGPAPVVNVKTAPKSSKMLCAVKQILAQSVEARQLVRDEIETHLQFRTQPHVMPLIDYTFVRIDEHTERAFLLFPLYIRGSLQDLLLKHLPHGPFFGEDRALRLIRGVCDGVAALHRHSPPLAHRDVCPRNIMLSDEGEGILIDLGSAVEARVMIATRLDALRVKEQAQIHSSMPYRALELWEPPMGAPIDERTDVWSIGATLYALIFGYSPFESARLADGSLKIAECTHLRTLNDVQFPSNIACSAAVKDLIVWLLNKEPSQRPNIDAVIERIDVLLAGPNTAQTAAASSAT
jgi:serine/threonine kinase 16